MLGLMACPGHREDLLSRGHTELECEELEVTTQQQPKPLDKEKPQSVSSIAADDRYDDGEDQKKDDSEGRQQRNNVHSYFHHIEEIQRAYMEKLYENAVDAPCQSTSFCEIHPRELIESCQQPFTLLPFFRNVEDGPQSATEPLFPGVYTVPESCEYCGAESTTQCEHPGCRRPLLYLQRKRPPFAPHDSQLWDPVTECSVDVPAEDEKNEEEKQNTSWIEGIFGEGNSFVR